MPTSRRKNARVLEASPAIDAPPTALIIWRDIADAVRAMALTAEFADETVSESTQLVRLERLIWSLTEPMRRLEGVQAFARRAAAGDLHAAAELEAQLAEILERVPSSKGLADRLVAGDESEKGAACGCVAGCGCAACVPAPRRGLALAVPVPSLDEETSAVLDESALVALLMTVDALHLDAGVQARRDAIDAVTALVRAAQPMVTFVRALRTGGRSGLAAAVRRMLENGLGAALGRAREGASDGGAQVMGFAPPDIPMPGFPGPPGFPGRGTPDLPGLKGIEKILAELKGRKRWDPDALDPNYVWWWREPVVYLPPGWIALLACMREAVRLLNERAAILPPTPPVPATWSTGISSIDAGGPCGGATIVIHGLGFDAIRATAVLLLPFPDGCRPLAAPASQWLDETITFTLPSDAISGPIGFGDAAYVSAYAAWITQQNELAAAIRRLKCGRLVRLLPARPLRDCPPDIGVNRLHAGTAIIDAFTVNGVAMLPIEPGDVATLAWSVRNADHLRLERVSATGPGFGGSAVLLEPVGTSRVIGAFTHTAPTLYTYRLTAFGPCGTVSRDVMVAASKRPRLGIRGIEVTQSVQTASSTVRLVERKPTVVRVTPIHGLAGFDTNAVTGVTGRIRIRRSDGVVSGWFDAANNSAPMAPTPGASITVIAAPSRNNTNDTLNFLVPTNWCVNTVSFEIEVRKTGYGALPGFAGFDGVATLTRGTFTFQPRRTLELRYIRVNWGGSTPTAAICQSTLLGAVPLLPTPKANVAALAGVGVQNPGGTGDDDRDDLVDDFDDRHNCSLWEALTEWLGSDCPDDDGAIWVLIPGVFSRGKAYDIPSNVCFTPPSNGPYAAHELSHCLNQEHVGVMCNNGQQAQGGDPPSDWPNNAQLVDVPFDSLRNKALSLAGTGVFDVMTYCGTPDNTWPMPVRWDRLWNEIGS